jgi:superfamily II DNA or RNA helicase
MATGTGKSVVFSHLPQLAPKDKRTLLLVHTKELVNQAEGHMARSNPSMDVGVEMAERSSSGEQIVCASIQTLGRKDSDRIQKFRPEDFAWIITDEAHRSISDQYSGVFQHFGLFEPEGSSTLVGCTATPKRGDGQAMGVVYEEISFSYSIQEAIREGWLSDVRGIRVRTTTDISKVATRNGDYDPTELDLAVNTPSRNNQIVEAWLNHGENRKTIGFTVSIQHAKDLAEAFMRAGVPAQAVWGADPDRAEKLRMHKAGVIRVLLCSQLLVEGYDDPSVALVIMARPTQSSTFFIQAAGRGTRLGPGIENLIRWKVEGRLQPGDKVDMLLMDVCDSTSRHSLVTLPTLFGMGSNLDLKGQSVMDAAKAVADILEKYPNVDLTKLEDITRLKSYVIEANLWTVNFCKEITEGSELQWHKTIDGSYKLYLPAKGFLAIKPNLLGQFTVKGVVKAKPVVQEGFEDLASALAFADRTVPQDALVLLRQEDKWHKAEVSPAQLKLLKKFRVPDHVIATMNKGSAAKLITQKIRGKK